MSMIDDVAKGVLEEVGGQVVAGLHGDDGPLALSRGRAGQQRDRQAEQVEAVAGHVGQVVAGVDPAELVEMVEVSRLLVEPDRGLEADAGLSLLGGELVDVLGHVERAGLQRVEPLADAVEQAARVRVGRRPEGAEGAGAGLAAVELRRDGGQVRRDQGRETAQVVVDDRRREDYVT